MIALNVAATIWDPADAASAGVELGILFLATCIPPALVSWFVAVRAFRRRKESPGRLGLLSGLLFVAPVFAFLLCSWVAELRY